MINIQFSEIIAAGSLFVAFISLVKSFLSDRRIKKLDLQLKERDLQDRKTREEDAKKADIEVEIYETGPRQMDRLRFYNKGQASAHNVYFTIPSDDEDNEISLQMTSDYLPFPKLEPFQKFEVPFYNDSMKPHQTIHITWDDDFGKGRSKEMVVDM